MVCLSNILLVLSLRKSYLGSYFVLLVRGFKIHVSQPLSRAVHRRSTLTKLRLRKHSLSEY
jgi:hypothetical protein